MAGPPLWFLDNRVSAFRKGLADLVRAVAADDDGLPGELRTPEHLDRRDELVEVDVEDPARHVPSVRLA